MPSAMTFDDAHQLSHPYHSSLIPYGRSFMFAHRFRRVSEVGLRGMRTRGCGMWTPGFLKFAICHDDPNLSHPYHRSLMPYGSSCLPAHRFRCVSEVGLREVRTQFTVQHAPMWQNAAFLALSRQPGEDLLFGLPQTSEIEPQLSATGSAPTVPARRLCSHATGSAPTVPARRLCSHATCPDKESKYRPHRILVS